MEKDTTRDNGKTFIESIKWCRYIVKVGYFTAALMTTAHVVWYFAARSVLVSPPDLYLRYFIILPAIGSFMLVFFVDRLVGCPRIPLFLKEYLSLSLFIAFSFYLCLTHDIARVLLASFILPIFSSTLFSNVKITRWIFRMSCLAVLLLGVIKYFAGKLDSSMLMQIFVALFMFLCSFLMAKIFIRYGHDNLAALTNFDTQQQDMKKQLKLDPFTGLYNRKTFDDYLPELLEEGKRTNRFLSLAMIDVDYFKNVNDLYGHAVGDLVLLNLAQKLKNLQAENIHVFRIGGEEFAILFRDCDTEEAYRICENMRSQMEAASIHEINNRRITISCGLVCMNPKNITLEAFTKAADGALYAAKHNGRNQVVICHDSVPPADPPPNHACSI